MQGDQLQKTLEERVIDFTASEVGGKGHKVLHETRLAQDLGVDGDDAVEFFEKFSDRFEVDLQDLHFHWDSHFAPEGTQLSLGSMIVLAGCGVAGVAIGEFVGVLPSWAWAILLLGIAFFVYQRWFAEEDSSIPVTVADLIDAARAGRWQKSY